MPAFTVYSGFQNPEIKHVGSEESECVTQNRLIKQKKRLNRIEL